MFIEIKSVVEMYHPACFVEETDKTRGAQILSAANTLNTLAFSRWSGRDYEGALRAATESAKIIEAHDTELTRAAEADFIYSTSRELIDHMQYEILLVAA